MKRIVLIILLSLLTSDVEGQIQIPSPAFGKKFANVERLSTGEWWKAKRHKNRKIDLNVPRDEVIAFAVYTHDHGTLKLTAQLFPLMPAEPTQLALDLQDESGEWLSLIHI